MQKSITKPKLEERYALSLSFGLNLDIQDNCQSFTTSLKKYLHQNSCSIWLKKSSFDNNYHRIYKSNKSILKPEKLHIELPLLKKLEKNNFLSFATNEVFFIENEGLIHTKKGIISFFKFSPAMILVMQNNNSETPLSKELFDQLKPILHQFSVTIKACLKRDQLLNQQAQSQKINEELAQYKMMVENISDGILISDLDHNIIYLNDQLTKMSGYSKKDILGKKTSEIHHHENQKGEIEQKIKQSFEGKLKRI